ncbi:hypothetical protein DV735_g879, partial [Chaetothyriales sp. CBS 134920]
MAIQSETDVFMSPPPEELANIYPALIDSSKVETEQNAQDLEHAQPTAGLVGLEALDLWTEPGDKGLDLPKPEHAAADDNALPAIPNSVTHPEGERRCLCGKKEEEESSSEEEETSSDESVDVPVAAPRKKFNDEEDSDDVADNWDEEEDSDEERAKTEKAKLEAAAKAKADAEAAKSHKTKSQRREEQIEARRRAKFAAEYAESAEEDEATRRARLRQQEKDADLHNAADLLGSVGGVSDKRAVKPVVVADPKTQGKAIDLSSMPLFKPANKTQFEALGAALVPLLRVSATKPHYALWLPTFVKQIAQDLPSAEIKKLASAVTALSNEKMKEEKAQDKSGKKTKAQQTKTSLNAGRGGAVDTEAYDDDGLDDGDFM